MKKHNSDCVRLHPAFQAPVRHTGFAIAAAMILGASPRVQAGVILNCGSNASMTHFSTTGVDPSTGVVPANGDYTTSAASGYTPANCVSGASGVALSESEGTGGKIATITLGNLNGITSTGEILLDGPTGVEISGALSVDDAATFKSGIDMSGTGITGLQAGTLSAKSTDAVNGSQLFSVSSALSTTRSDLASLSTSTSTSFSGVSSSLGSLSTGIVTAASDIASLSTGVVSLSTGMSTLSGSVSTNASSIASLSTGMSALSSSVSTNTSSIVSLSTGVASLSTGALALSSSVSTNASNIGSMSTGVASLSTGALALSSSISTNTSSIVSLSTGVASLSTGVVALSSSVSTNASNIVSVSTGLGSVSTGLSTVVSRVAVLSPLMNQSAGATGRGASVLGTTLGGGAGGLVQTQGGTWNGTATTLIDASTCQTAVGPDTTAAGVCASAGSTASGGAAAGGTAYGAYAQAQSANTTAVGFRAIASYAGSVALGYQARAIADPTVAVGANALASGNDAVALGAGATASAAGAVALGANSVATDPQTVSVGSAGNERRLVNVAPGIAPTDAVNVSQLNALRDSVSAVQRGAYAGIASAMAMPALMPLHPGHILIAAGAASYGGYGAFAIGLSYRSLDAKWMVGMAGSISGASRVGGKFQMGYAF